MKESLLKYIVCPICEGDFDLKKENQEKEEIIKGKLVCNGGHSFDIAGGIPRLLYEKDYKGEKKQTKDSFSSKWKKVPDFGHEQKSKDFYIDWYLQRHGFVNISSLSKFLSSKKYILDAGCGLGRDVKLFAENASGTVFGVDISDSIDIAYKHIGNLTNVHLIKADLTRLPFRKNFFDYLSCDQVLHHTFNTHDSFKYLTGFLNSGGEIAIYVYKKKGPIREFCDDYLRQYATNASSDECLQLSEAITAFGKSLSDLNIEFEIPKDIPVLSIEAGKYNLQRFIFYHVLKCYWNDNFDYDTNVMTNFDWYHPKFAHRHSPDEVTKWFNDEGLEIVNFNVIESGISVRGGKS